VRRKQRGLEHLETLITEQLQVRRASQ
jgi:hypothetical protein